METQMTTKTEERKKEKNEKQLKGTALALHKKKKGRKAKKDFN